MPDVVFAVLMAVAQCAVVSAMAAHSPGRGSVGVVGYGLLIAGSLALAWRRQHPLIVLAGTATAIYAYYALGYFWLNYPLGPALVVVVIAFATVGACAPLRATLLSGGLLALLVPAMHLLIGAAIRRPVDLAPWWFAPVGFFGGAGAIGVAIRNRRLATRAARESAAEVERRLAEERRLAIAREVHDVVAHSLATINVQAGVAAHVADKRPEQAKAALLAIKDASHTALEDLRATLSILRTGGTELGPAPSLARLDELTGRATELGLVVTVDGAVHGLPAPVDAAAYRIVQEAITNTVRHAAGATAITIHLERAADRLVLDVVDDGRPAAEPVAGNGLRGMRERVETLRGSLRAGPGPTGFRVHAEFPMHPDLDTRREHPIQRECQPQAELPGADRPLTAETE